MTRSGASWIVSVLLLAAACGDDAAGGDAGSAVDGSATVDGAVVPHDASAPGDGGLVGDASGLPDDAAAPTADAAPPLNALELDGQIGVVGAGRVPRTGKVALVWQAQNDALYKFGEGASVAATYHVSLLEEPPPAALLGGTLGVGVLVLFAADFELPLDGIVDANALVAALRGVSGQHAVIWLGAALASSWPSLFPAGYACGVCVPADDAGFDTWAPTDCTNVEIQAGALDDIAFCNWT